MKKIADVFREMMEWLFIFVFWIGIGILTVIIIAAFGIGYVMWVLLLTVVMVFALLQNLIIGIFGKRQ